MHCSHQGQYFRKPQPANWNPISISYPIPLSLNFFYSIHWQSWRWAHILPALYHVSHLPSSLLFWQYFSFGTEGVQEVARRASLRCHQPRSEQLLSWDLLTFSSYTNLSLSHSVNNGFRSDCVPYLDYSVARKNVVSSRIKSHSWPNDDKKIWILNITFQTNKQGFSDACSTQQMHCNWKDKVKSVPALPGPLCMNICTVSQIIWYLVFVSQQSNNT